MQQVAHASCYGVHYSGWVNEHLRRSWPFCAATVACSPPHRNSDSSRPGLAHANTSMCTDFGQFADLHRKHFIPRMVLRLRRFRSQLAAMLLQVRLLDCTARIRQGEQPTARLVERFQPAESLPIQTLCSRGVFLERVAQHHAALAQRGCDSQPLSGNFLRWLPAQRPPCC